MYKDHVTMNIIIVMSLMLGTSAMRLAQQRKKADNPFTWPWNKADQRICVHSRLIKTELPYVQSWIRHYESLGISKFHLLTNHVNDYSTIQKFLGAQVEQTKSLVNLTTDLSVTQIKPNGKLNKAPISLYYTERNVQADNLRNWPVAKQILTTIREECEFVVSVDIDEFWVLPKGNLTFSDLIAAHNDQPDIYLALWTMVLNDGFKTNLPPYQTWRGRETKWMARPSKVDNFCQHKPCMNQKSTTVFKETGEMLHFWGRSLQDQLLKGMTGQGTQKGGEGVKATIKEINMGRLPERLRILAFLSVHPVGQEMNFAKPLMMIDEDLQKEYIVESFNGTAAEAEEYLNKAKDAYEKYKTCLKGLGGRPRYGPGTKNLMHVMKWLRKNKCTQQMNAGVLGKNITNFVNMTDSDVEDDGDYSFIDDL